MPSRTSAAKLLACSEVQPRVVSASASWDFQVSLAEARRHSGVIYINANMSWFELLFSFKKKRATQTPLIYKQFAIWEGLPRQPTGSDLAALRSLNAYIA